MGRWQVWFSEGLATWCASAEDCYLETSCNCRGDFPPDRAGWEAAVAYADRMARGAS